MLDMMQASLTANPILGFGTVLLTLIALRAFFKLAIR